MSAVAAAKDVFAERNIGSDQLPPASPQLLPLDEAAEAQRASRVAEQFGKVAPGVVQYTTDVLFRDLWLRPDLAPRDRSLVTVSALIASGQVAQIPYHLNRSMDNGLTQPQAAEALTHLAFYAGWPNVFSTLPVAKDVFEKRSQTTSGREKEQDMRSVTLLASLFSLAWAAFALAADSPSASQTVSVAGSQPAAKGPAEYFTGNVRVDPLFGAKDTAPFSGAYVTFEPGARSAWHTHPAGQHLIVTAGVGWTQEWGRPVVELRAGDVVWCPPGVKHWHGATPTTAMTHIALTGTVGGKNVDWLEKVSDEQYRKR